MSASRQLALVLLTAVASCASPPDSQQPLALGEPRWAMAIGGSGYQSGNAVAIDPSGDVLVGGGFAGIVDFGDRVAYADGYQCFLTKRAGEDGTSRWTLTLEGHSCEFGAAAIDGAGNVIVTGAFTGQIDFGGQLRGPLVAMGPDLFVASYDPAGVLRWVNTLGELSNASGVDVAVDRDGNVYVVGWWFRGTIDLGDGPLTSGIDHDSFLLAFDAEGGWRWGRAFQGGGEQIAYEVAVSVDGDVVMSGGFNAPIMLGGSELTPAPAAGFIARYRPTGEHLWSRVLAAAGGGWSGELSITDDGTIVTIAGIRDEALNTDVPNLTALDRSGSELWSSSPRSGTAVPLALATLPSGAIISGGYITSEQLDVGSGPMAGRMYLSAVGAGGQELGGRAFSDNSSTLSMIMGLAPGAGGEYALTGHFAGTTDLGTGPMTSGVDDDIIIAVFDPLD